MRIDKEAAWDRDNCDYDKGQKGPLFKGIMESLVKEGKVPDLVISVGDGKSPLSLLDIDDQRYKLIRIDLVGENSVYGNTMCKRFDIEKLGDNRETRALIARVAPFLGIETPCDSASDRKVADLITFCEVLNYVDWEIVVSESLKYLKSGGRVLFYGKAGIGHVRLFSQNGLKDNNDLVQLMKGRGFQIEHYQVDHHRGSECDLLIFSEC